MANTKIKRLSAYEKQRLEDSYKRAGNKVVRKLEKDKNFIENYLKNLLAQPTKNEINKKGFETEQTAKKTNKRYNRRHFSATNRSPQSQKLLEKIRF